MKYDHRRHVLSWHYIPIGEPIHLVRRKEEMMMMMVEKLGLVVLLGKRSALESPSQSVH